MALKSKTVDMGGLSLKINDIEIGVTKPRSTGTVLSSSELAKLDGVTGDLTKLNTVSTNGSLCVMQEVTFTETSGAGVYTGTITVPAGAYIHDIIVHGVAVWDNAGAVDMDVGIAGTATAYFDITSLKAAGDLVAGESISFGTGLDGGEGGTLAGNGAGFTRYAAAARDILGVITTASTGGSTGRTRMVVIHSLPVATSAAVKV